MQGFQQIREAACRRQVLGYHAEAPFAGGELLHDVRFQHVRAGEAAAAEAQSHHRMALGPVVAGVDVQPREQFFAALEQLLQRVQEQALAESAGARQEVVGALVEQALDVGRLVDVVAVLLAQLAERLDADRQSAVRHQPILPHRVVAQNRGGAVVRPRNRRTAFTARFQHRVAHNPDGTGP